MTRARRAGQAFVEIGLRDKLTGQLKRLGARLKGFASGIAGIAKKVALANTAIAGLGLTAAAALTPAILKAGDFNETVGAFEDTFKNQAASVRKWAQDYSKAIGRSEGQTLEFLTGFQALIRGMGIGEQQAAQLSKRMAELSVDFASFKNLSDEQAASVLTSSLLGNVSDVALKSGIDTRATNVNKTLKGRGIDPRTATEQQKLGARLQIITKGLADAQGNADKTSGSLNNQLKALNASYQGLMVTLGNALIPIAGQLVAGIKLVIERVREWLADNSEFIASLAQMAGKAIAVAAAMQVFVAGMVAGMTGLNNATGAANGFMQAIIGIAEWIGQAVPILGEAFASLTDTVFDVFKEISEIVDSALAGISAAFEAGDLGLAVEIAMANVKLVFQQGTNFMAGLWDSFTLVLQNVWDTTISNVTAAFQKFTSFTLRGLQRVLSLAGRFSSWAKQAARDIGRLADEFERAGKDTGRKLIQRRAGRIAANADRGLTREQAIAKQRQKVAALNAKAEDKRKEAVKRSAAESKKRIADQKKSTKLAVEGLFKSAVNPAAQQAQVGTANRGTFSSAALSRGLLNSGQSVQQRQLAKLDELKTGLSQMQALLQGAFSSLNI